MCQLKQICLYNKNKIYIKSILTEKETFLLSHVRLQNNFWSFLFEKKLINIISLQRNQNIYNK